MDYRESTPDSTTFLRTVDDLTRDHRQVVEEFKRIVFNYIGSNKDDHAKNFCFIMSRKGEWSVSPAYDIGFSKGDNDLHQMRLGNKFRNAEVNDFKKLTRDFDVSGWAGFVEKTLAAFEKWPDLAKENGIPQKYIQIIYQKIRENTRRIERPLRQSVEL